MFKFSRHLPDVFVRALNSTGGYGKKGRREKRRRGVVSEKGEERWRKEVKDCRKDEKSTISLQTLRHRCRCQIKASSIPDNFFPNIDYSERKWSTRKNPASCFKKVICKKNTHDVKVELFDKKMTNKPVHAASAV